MKSLFLSQFPPLAVVAEEEEEEEDEGMAVEEAAYRGMEWIPS